MSYDSDYMGFILFPTNSRDLEFKFNFLDLICQPVNKGTDQFYTFWMISVTGEFH